MKPQFFYISCNTHQPEFKRNGKNEPFRSLARSNIFSNNLHTVITNVVPRHISLHISCGSLVALLDTGSPVLFFFGRHSRALRRCNASCICRSFSRTLSLSPLTESEQSNTYMDCRRKIPIQTCTQTAGERRLLAIASVVWR